MKTFNYNNSNIFGITLIKIIKNKNNYNNLASKLISRMKKIIKIL